MEAISQQKTRVLALDPGKPETWVNIPCPVDLTPIQAALTKTGGLNDFGKPNFIIVWGQEYRTWDLGKQRIHFDEGLVPAIHTPNRFACRPEAYARAMRWLEDREAERNKSFLDLDWKRYNKYSDIAEFFNSAQVLPGDWVKLSSDPDVDMADAMKLIPAGWRFISGLWSHEYIGQQVFYVLQWLTPAELGDQNIWDASRFDAAYMPETDQDEPMVDINGAYPTHGSYENVALRIGEQEIISIKHGTLVGETVEYEIYRFKTPTIDNVVGPLRELLSIRDRLSDTEKSKEFRDARRHEKYREDMERDMAEHRDDFTARFKDAAPVGYGSPTNISANKTKFNN